MFIHIGLRIADSNFEASLSRSKRGGRKKSSSQSFDRYPFKNMSTSRSFLGNKVRSVSSSLFRVNLFSNHHSMSKHREGRK